MIARIKPGEKLERYIDNNKIILTNSNDYTIDILDIERTLFGFKVVYVNKE